MSAPAASTNVTLTLPDGKVRTFTRGVTGAQKSLLPSAPASAKAALVIMVDGKEWGPVPPH